MPGELSRLSFLVHLWQKERNRVIFTIYYPFYKEFSFKSKNARGERRFLKKAFICW
jgi:hypothetical protein